MSAPSHIASALLAAICLAGCDSSHTEPLPPLAVPADFTVAEQLDLLRVHFDEFNRYFARGIDTRFDSKSHVSVNMAAAIMHHRRWGNTTQGYDSEDTERIYAMRNRIPEVNRYRGARLHAVAIGLLARSLWRRDPPPVVPTLKELRRCTFGEGIREVCNYSARTLTLMRFILAARNADPALFKRLSRMQPPDRPGNEQRPARTNSQ